MKHLVDVEYKPEQYINKLQVVSTSHLFEQKIISNLVNSSYHFYLR